MFCTVLSAGASKSSRGRLAMCDLLTIVYISAIFLLLHRTFFDLLCISRCCLNSLSGFNFVSHNLMACSSFYVQHVCVGFFAVLANLLHIRLK